MNASTHRRYSFATTISSALETFLVLSVLALAGYAMMQLVGCSAQVRRDTSAGIEHATDMIRDLRAAHQAVYERTTDALGAQNAADHGTLEDYDRAVAPINAEFDARGLAIRQLSGQLIAASVLLDGTTDSESARSAARMVRAAMDDTLSVLGEGDVLPPVPIPVSVRVVIVELARVVQDTPATADAGGPDG